MKKDIDTIVAADDPNEYQETWNVLIAGDVVARSRFRGQEVAAEPHFSSGLVSKIRSADISIANHEGPVETHSSPIMKSGPNISVDKQTPNFLRTTGFDAVTLANNHIMDYGAKGLQETITACDDAGLQVCGAGDDFSDAIQPLIIEPETGTSVAIVNVCEQEFGIAEANTPGSAWISHPKTLLEITETAKKTDVLIVVAHGGIENIPIPPLQRQQQLRWFVDAGADLVVGHHPHVPQGWEQYGGGMIFYSLGNFLFDRESPSLRDEKEKRGLVVSAEFDGSSLAAARLLPIENENGRIRQLETEQERTEYLQYLHSLTDITSESDLLERYWQQIAVDRFIKYYGRHLHRTASGTQFRALRYPITRRHRWDSDRREDEMLWLLNLFRNESKRWLVETALSVLSGEIEDKRTPEIQEHARSLVENTLPIRYNLIKSHL